MGIISFCCSCWSSYSCPFYAGSDDEEVNNNDDVDGVDDNDEREEPIHLKTETNEEKLKIIIWDCLILRWETSSRRKMQVNGTLWT